MKVALFSLILMFNAAHAQSHLESSYQSFKKIYNDYAGLDIAALAQLDEIETVFQIAPYVKNRVMRSGVTEFHYQEVFTVDQVIEALDFSNSPFFCTDFTSTINQANRQFKTPLATAECQHLFYKFFQQAMGPVTTYKLEVVGQEWGQFKTVSIFLVDESEAQVLILDFDITLER